MIFIEIRKFPIFAQERGLTLEKYRFKVYKFRTLKDSNTALTYSRDKILSHPEIKDSLTVIGKILRLSGLDELPQLFNILKGDMNFIGPRPLMLSDLEKIKFFYPELYIQREQINSKPGLTGLWQISKNTDYSVQLLIDKDIEYENNKSLLLNISILLKTIKLSLLLKQKDPLFDYNFSATVFYFTMFYLQLTYFYLLLIIFINN